MKQHRSFILRISSGIMLAMALPMMLWCLSLIDQAALDHTYAGAGCFALAMVYVFSMVTAIAGLVFAKRPYYYRWCRIMGYLQLAAMLILIWPMQAYSVLTMPPLITVTGFYLAGARESKQTFE